jgi:hypothetical protein
MKAKKRIPSMNIIRQIEKDAVAQMNAVRHIVEPTLRQFEATRQAVLNPYKDIKLTPDMFTSRSITYKEMDHLLAKHSRSTSSSTPHELLYNKTDKSLKRYIVGKSFVYKFGRGKRFDLVTALISLGYGQYGQTKTLAKVIGSPSVNAVQKMVGEINAKTRQKLELKAGTSLIEGREGHGYRISQDFILHEDKL